MSSKIKKEKGSLSRRDFLKAISAIGGAAIISSGCSPEPLDKLVSYAIPPEDVIPGVPNFYSTALPHSPVGSSIVVKIREGRAIKVEGNPLDPVCKGSTTAETQASLQGLYDPDRIKQPLFRNDRNNLVPLTWTSALDILSKKLNEKPKNIYFLSDNTTGTLDVLINSFCNKINAKRIKYEMLSYEHISYGNYLSFGKRLIPTYKIDKANYLLSFGADFLETWLSPDEYNRRFSKMHSIDGKRKGKFVQIEPKLTLTGAKADEWVPAAPNTSLYLALGLINYIKQKGLNKKPIPNTFSNLSDFNLSTTSRITGVSTESIKKIAKDFAKSKSALAIGGSISNAGNQEHLTIVAINILNHITNNLDKVDFDNNLSLSNASPYSDILDFVNKAKSGEVDIVLIHNTNPVYSLSDSLDIEKAFEKIPYKISFNSNMDETTEFCDLVLPDAHPLEQWGDYEGKKGNRYIIQPVMKPLYGNLSVGECIVSIFNDVEPTKGNITSKSYLDYLKNSWRKLSTEGSFEDFWNKVLVSGGLFKEYASASNVSFSSSRRHSVVLPEFNQERLNLYITPSYRFYDGRSANKSWLQELPDLLTTAVWDSWVEINSKLADKLKIKEGDYVEIESNYGKITTQAYLSKAMRPDTVSISLGQGHTSMGRYASDRGVNPINLLDGNEIGQAGNLNWSSTKVVIRKTGRWSQFVKVQHSYSQENRDIAQTIALSKLIKDHHDEKHDEHHNGTSYGQDKGHHDEHHGDHHATYDYDMYKEYDYFVHKWGMNIDLDKCVGCGACVVACYAENNIPVVGKEQVANGRHMAWLKLERFQDEEDHLGDTRIDTRILPQMCQHCENAPCEPVCPVFATYHNPEGLNLMVYSRCVGTRYCSNNCSYKVRRFNWFKYEWPEPLNYQLNPDVTVRSKGVMEKCNLCLQRINYAKDKAKDENRKVRDGEIRCACEQACGCDAITFGDLNDPKSKLSKLNKSERTYHVLSELNTRPTISYLKKIEWDKG
tara:strand:- start:1890 stop:4889 length:3000 start_codon:yes stop_codon:yes gene_type:complete